LAFASLALCIAIAPAQGQPAAWANFDFVPGNKILFADDFSKDRVGNFPQHLELVAGNLEIVDWKGARWLRAVGDGSRFDVPLAAVLPQRFTLEFDIVINESRLIYQSVHAASANEADDAYTGLDGGDIKRDLPTTALAINQHEAGLGGGNAPTATKVYIGGSGEGNEGTPDRVFRVRLQADGRYVKMYVNEDRVANIPNANFGRTNKLRFSLNGATEGPVYVGNIVVAGGGQQLYDALLADGRVATQGILFDTGSDRIRLESGPTLKTIGDMLKEHADLKLMIEGHTDNVGSAASNKALSEKRAASVRQYLVTNFGVDAARLASSGFGDTKPAAPNTTAEGRQQNRRVELVKM
jgi:outer membrane protein OmpA-like peptidoglycan-associated protein